MAQLAGMADGTTQSDYANARVDSNSGALVETDPWSSGQTFKALMQKYNENWSEFSSDNPAMAKLGQTGKVPAGQTISIRANHFTAYAHNPYTGPLNGFPPPTALGTPPKLPTGGAPIAPPPPATWATPPASAPHDNPAPTPAPTGGAPIPAPTPAPAPAPTPTSSSSGQPMSGVSTGTTRADYPGAIVSKSSGALVEVDKYSSGQPFSALMQKYNENWSEFSSDNPSLAKEGQNGKVPAGQFADIRANHYAAYLNNPHTGAINGFPPPASTILPKPTSGAPVANPSGGGGSDPTDTSGGTDPTLGGDPTDPTDTSGGTDPSLGGDPTDPTDTSGGTDPTLGGDPTDPADPSLPIDTTGSTDPSSLGGDPTDPTATGGTSSNSVGAAYMPYIQAGVTPGAAYSPDQLSSNLTGQQLEQLGFTYSRNNITGQDEYVGPIAINETFTNAGGQSGPVWTPVNGTNPQAAAAGAALASPGATDTSWFTNDGGVLSNPSMPQVGANDPSSPTFGSVASTLGAAPTDPNNPIDPTDTSGNTDASTLGAAPTDPNNPIDPTDTSGNTDASTLGADPTDNGGDPTDPNDPSSAIDTSGNTDASTLGAAPSDQTDSTGGTDQASTTGSTAVASSSNGSNPNEFAVALHHDQSHSGNHEHNRKSGDGKHSRGGVFGIKNAFVNLTAKATGFRAKQANDNQSVHPLAGTVTEASMTISPQLNHLPSSGNKTYTVEPGNTLTQIAQTHGVSLAALEAANPNLKDPNLIFPGQVIHMPDSASATASSSDSSAHAQNASGISASASHEPSKLATAAASPFPAKSTYPPGEGVAFSSQSPTHPSTDEGGGSVTGGASPFGSGINAVTDQKSTRPGDTPKKPTSGVA